MRNDSIGWFLAVAVVTVYGEVWKWPDAAESVRIDTKVRFVEDEPPNRKYEEKIVQRDEASSTGEQKRLEPHRPTAFSADSIPKLMCKCVSSTPNCNRGEDLTNVCSSGKYLCCYPHKNSNKHEHLNSEVFNELEDERLTLLPATGNDRNGQFSPPSDRFEETDLLVGPYGSTGNIGPPKKRPILVGPAGPTGIIGLSGKNEATLVGPKGPNREVLVGPGGPTGFIGPGGNDRGVLVGPSGPIGDPAPQDIFKETNGFQKDIAQSESAQRGVLVGPGGPTGIIGPAYNQRPVLVGPGGPTGIIGPGIRGSNRGVLVGPGGPTGNIGPYGYYRQQYQQGVLVGPGGPTGIIGPGRQLLVGPGGPTGVIGPTRNGYFGK